MEAPEDSSLQVIGPYRLEKLLGRGGMGEVYRAYDRRLDRRVAIKHVRPEVGEQSSARARFRNEAWTVARLSHPAIVPIFDILEEEDGDWIVMELVEGPSLAEKLRDGPLDLATALRWGREIAGGLEEAHAKGIVHRDLKAENVMIAASGHARILDFGLAKRLIKGEDEASISVAGEVLGTVRAMSPEQARGFEVDARSDLFSLGTLLYEMLTATSPFRGPTVVDTLTRVCTHHPPPVAKLDPAIPRQLSDLVDRLLQKAPELRPAGAREVGDELAELAAALSRSSLSPSEVTALHEETLVDPSPPAAVSSAFGVVRRRRHLALASGALLVLAAIAFSAMRGSDRDPPASAAATAGPALGVEVPAASSHELYLEGMAFLERYDLEGNIERAITAFQRALTRDPDSAAAHAGLARAYWRQYQHGNKDRTWLDQARAVAERAVELDEDLAVARVSRGLVYSSLGRSEEALQDFENALILDPTNADVHRGIAGLDEAAGRFEDSLRAYSRAVELRPQDRELHDLLGTVYYRLGRYQDAEAEFLRSIDVAPDGVIGYRNLAAVYHMQGRPDEAAAQLQKALEIQPTPSLYANLGTLLFYQGLYPRAAEAFEKALEHGGSNNLQIWGNLGDAYRWMPDRKELAREAYLRAIQLIEQQLDSEPGAELESRRILYLAKRGDRDPALSRLARLGELSVPNAATLFRLAVACEIVGERQQALGFLGRALEAGFSPDEMARDPELVALRSDPRYHRLIMKSGAAVG